jgi:hypothetical protein
LLTFQEAKEIRLGFISFALWRPAELPAAIMAAAHSAGMGGQGEGLPWRIPFPKRIHHGAIPARKKRLSALVSA